MGDKKTPGFEEEESLPASADGSEREKSGEAPRSYYYDDATGYEIYKEEDETDEDVDEQDD
jgi:hypothetical protein